MKKFAAFILSIALVVAAAIGLSSCKDDDPPSRPKLSFAETERTVNETAGTIEIEITLDKAYSDDLVIEYELGGTADDQDVVGTDNADYEIVGSHGEVEIPAGETTGIIEIEIYNDAAFEEDETIEIAITDTNTDEIELTADDEMVITITNDDAQITASFVSTTLTVSEDVGADGLLEIAVSLDQAATSDVTIEYSLDGTALDSITGFDEEIPPNYWDYYVNATRENVGKLVIPAGQSSANIELLIVSDFVFENSETIEITLTGGDAQIGANSEMTITVEQEDGKAIALVWDQTYTDVDMDLFLFAGETTDALDGPIALSFTIGFTPQQEVVIIPYAISDEIAEFAFGLSCVYYEGSEDPMNFEVHFADFVDGAVENVNSREIRTAAYTLDNLNPWETGEDLQALPIVQTFRIVDGEYVDISDIVVPASGSRMRTNKLPNVSDRLKGLKKQKSFPSRPL